MSTPLERAIEREEERIDKRIETARKRLADLQTEKDELQQAKATTE